jgi:hypothetical protein
MSSRQDPTSKRLLNLLEQAKIMNTKQVTDAIPLHQEMNELLSILEGKPLMGVLWRGILSLNEKDKRDIEMLQAFETAGLDHRNPFHWRKLLECFAEAHFGKKKTKPIQWDAYQLCVLLKDYFDVTRNRPGLSDLEACKLLKRDRSCKDKYGDYNIDALRKLVRRAKSPKYNMLLRHPEMRNPLLQQIRDECEHRGIPWDELFGKQIAEVVRLAGEDATQSKT